MLKPIGLDDVKIAGDLAFRAGLNFERLEPEPYQPEPVLPPPAALPG